MEKNGGVLRGGGTAWGGGICLQAKVELPRHSSVLLGAAQAQGHSRLA